MTGRYNGNAKSDGRHRGINRRRGNEPRRLDAHPPFWVMPLFCIYLLSWFLQIGARVKFLAAIRFELVLGILLSLAAAIYWPRRYTNDRTATAVLLMAGLLLLAMICQIPFSADRGISVDVFFTSVVRLVCVGAFVVAFVRTPRDLSWLMAALLLGMGYITYEAFRSSFSGGLVWENQGIPRLHGGTSQFRHPNTLAGVAIGTLPFVWYLWPCARSRILRLGMLVIAVSSVGCVVYTGSRAGYIAMVVLVCLAALHGRRIGRGLAIAGTLLIVAWLLMPAAYQARIETIFTGQDMEGGSINARKQILSDATVILATQPWGVGVGAFPAVRMKTFGRRQDTHNLYLQAATNLGIQGLLIFLLFVLATIRSLRSTVVRANIVIGDAIGGKGRARMDSPKDEGHEDPVAVAMLCRAVAQATIGYLVVRLVLGLFGMDLYELYWWLAGGLAIAAARLMSDIEANGPVYSRRSHAESAQRTLNPHG